MLYYYDTVAEAWNIADKYYKPLLTEVKKTKTEFDVFQEQQAKIEAYEQKKAEAKDLILSQYSETDQVNLSRKAQLIVGLMVVEQRPPTEEEFKALQYAKNVNEFINGVLKELHTNRENADFSKFQ